MPVLTPQQRNTLETAVKQDRKAAETGAFNALHGMAVDHPEPFAHMNPEQRRLLKNLRSKARLLGDPLPADGTQKIDNLAYELTYETQLFNDNSLTLKAWVESMGITIINRDIPENQYTKQCFDYIHKNPVKAGLVKKPEEWEFSSYQDVIGIRNGKLINRNMIRELGLMEGIN